MEEIQSRHKKELKSLEGEKRAAIKKAKALKGKKGKEALASLETEFDEKVKTLKAKHDEELSGEAGDIVQNDAETPSPDESATAGDDNKAGEEQDERTKKQEKARRKREAKKEKERQRIEDQERETAEAGPARRQLELDALQTQLKPASLAIVEIPSDGNCLYRAVAAQCDCDYVKTREICANILISKENEYAPFCEFTDSITNFEEYVDRVRSSSEWGGHLELRALSEGLKRPIVVFSADQPKLVLGDEDAGKPIFLSYHLHYYSLGEHYNRLEKVTQQDDGA